MLRLAGAAGVYSETDPDGIKRLYGYVLKDKTPAEQAGRFTFPITRSAGRRSVV